MADRSSIEWTDATWNPIRGCTRVSEGCRNCYAERMAARFGGPGRPYEGLARMTEHGPRWTGQVRLVHDALEVPLRWRRPRRIFVNSMSDPFHPNVSWGAIAAIYGIMALTPHTYQALTKRAERAVQFFTWLDWRAEQLRDLFPDESLNWRRWQAMRGAAIHFLGTGRLPHIPGENPPWPLPNVWLGVSVENQQAADERIPYLLQTPAAVRFLSMEPLLGPVSIRPALGLTFDNVPVEPPRIGWVIVGGESGPNARPMQPDWVRSIRDQCQAAQVPFFFKGWGEWAPAECDPQQGTAYRWVSDGSVAATSPNRSHYWWGGKYGDGRPLSVRMGKRRAGALLDGREWREWPHEGRIENADA